MKSLTILIDMDDTLENLCTAWCVELNKRYGTTVLPSEIKEWNLQKSFPGLTPNEIYAPLYDEAFWDTVKPIPGAQEALKSLAIDGHRLLIVTASHPQTVCAKLNKVLFKYFPYIGYRDVIIASQKDVIHGDVRIDDNPENLICAKDGSLRILYSQPHNKRFDAEANDIYRVDEWREILSLVRMYTYLKESED